MQSLDFILKRITELSLIEALWSSNLVERVSKV